MKVLAPSGARPNRLISVLNHSIPTLRPPTLMHDCTISQLARLITGTPVDACIGQHRITGGTIDSRTVGPDQVFFAMPGNRNHGMLFADDAIARGASCVVSDFNADRSPNDRKAPSACLHSSDGAETDRRTIRVASTVVALQELARWNRRQSKCLIIGVTGSVGKTTTRQLIAAVMMSRFKGIQSPGNFNNALGVPLSLLQLEPAHDFAVLELAAGKPGDIRFLSEIAQPEFAVVTRVSAAHLESFESVDAILRTKQELAESIGRGGTVFLNADDPAVLSMASATSAEVILFGTTSEATVRASHVSACNGVCSFTVDSTRFSLRGGRQLVTAALAAVAVGRVAGIADSQIAESVAEFQPDAGRGRVVLNFPWTVIDDTYNASPASVMGAIESLSDWPESRHRILVFGDMLELGKAAEHLHYDIGRAIARSSIDHAVIYGSHADHVIRGTQSAGQSLNRCSSFHDVNTLQAMLDCILTAGDVICVKGSRGMKMDRIVNWLCEQSRAATTDRFAA